MVDSMVVMSEVITDEDDGISDDLRAVWNGTVVVGNHRVDFLVAFYTSPCTVVASPSVVLCSVVWLPLISLNNIP